MYVKFIDIFFLQKRYVIGGAPTDWHNGLRITPGNKTFKLS